MSNEALRTSWRRAMANDLVRSLNEGGNENYYLFIGKVDPWPNEAIPPAATDSDFYSSDTFRNAVALKRLETRNISLVVPRYNWTTGTTYVEYDPTVDLHVSGSLSKFYVLTSTNNVYKCISNNNGAASSVEPSHTTQHIVKNSDGYRWKFMYSLTENMQNFLTDEYIPVSFVSEKVVDETINQLNVQETAEHGTIDHAEVVTIGSNVFDNSEPVSAVVGTETAANNVKVRLNQSASNVNGRYVGYSLYFDDGRGEEIGNQYKITEYNGTTKQVTIDPPLRHRVYVADNSKNLKGSSYKILPRLRVDGDGSDCSLVPTLSSENKITGVDIINRGKNYQDAEVKVLTTSSSGTTNSTFKLYFSPPGGHGSDAVRELQATRVMILMKADQGSKTSNWPAENDFRQFGIVKNPVLNLRGVTADAVVAGDEYTRLTELTVFKPFGVSAGYVYDSVDGTYKVGNYILGSETLSTAKILSFKNNPDNEFSILDVENLKGSFKVADPIQDKFRYVFGSVVGSFVPGETITQYVSGTGGTGGATAQGVVETYSTTPFKELVVIGVTGSFTGTTGDIVGVCSGASGSAIRQFSIAGGELLKQFTINSTGDVSFVTVDTDNKQNYSRAIQQKATKLDLTAAPTYRLTTKLSVAGSGFTDTYFTEDSGVTQENAVTKNISTGNVAWFKSYSGTTGDLYLTNVVGQFNTGSTLDTVASSGIVVTNVSEPEVVLGSGEVLYIQNIRPVERIREQEEEFRIVLGF